MSPADMGVDLDVLRDLVRAALPEAVPDVVASMFTAWIPYVEPHAGVAIVDRIAATLPPPAWAFADPQLARWPAPVRERALQHIRDLPRDETRVLALCEAALHLSLDDRREALDGILDGTLRRLNWDYVKPRSNTQTIATLVRTLPEAWQEEWIASESVGDDGKPDLDRELAARRKLGPLPDDELTDAERSEIVGWPQPLDEGEFVRRPAFHLHRVRKHLALVPIEQRLAWLELALRLTSDPFALHLALTSLLPGLSGEARRRAEHALVASVVSEGGFLTAEQPWELVPDHELAPLLWRLRDDAYGHRRDELIAHVIAARDDALIDRCLQPLLEHLPTLDPDAVLETVAAMAPWLAARSDGAAARVLVELEIPPPSRKHNPQYWIERVFDRARD